MSILKNKPGKRKEQRTIQGYFLFWRASQTKDLIYNGNKRRGVFDDPMPLY